MNAKTRRTRDQFLAIRDRCASNACVAQSHRERTAEIAGIAFER